MRDRGVVGAGIRLRAARRTHEPIEVLSVLRRGGRAEREREPDRLVDHAAGESVRAHRGEQSRRDRLRHEHRTVDHHEQLIVRERDGVGAAQAAPHEHHELAQHDVHAARIDLRAELGEARRRGRHHDHGPLRRDRARQLGQLRGSQVWSEIVGEHGRRVRGRVEDGGGSAGGLQP